MQIIWKQGSECKYVYTTFSKHEVNKTFLFAKYEKKIVISTTTQLTM